MTFAGCCLDAGLHPLVVILEPTRAGAAGHAIIVVWLGGALRAHGYPLSGSTLATVPAEMCEDLRAEPSEPGSFVAVDITAATRQERFEDAVEAGAAMTTGRDSRWRWKTGVDVGVAYDPAAALPMPDWPSHDVIVQPYLDSDDQAGPLTQIQARRSREMFHSRDELDQLLEWCTAPNTSKRTKICLLHGVGGSGKTHLAAEIAHRMAAPGWITGFLSRNPDQADLRWLGDVVSALLVVVDYADVTRESDVLNLMREIKGRNSPTIVLLTARTISDWWSAAIEPALAHDNHLYEVLNVALPEHHPRTTSVFRKALRRFAPESDFPSDIEEPVGRWTTLDLVMLAWLRSKQPDLPINHDDLYEEVLAHEFRYWQRAGKSYFGHMLPINTWRVAGACVSLVAPLRDRLPSILTAVEALRSDSLLRSQVAELLIQLLPPEPGDGMMAIRPDPIADHLVLSELMKPVPSDDPRRNVPLLFRTLSTSSPAEQFNACVMLTRAGQQSRKKAAELSMVALTHMPGLWRPALEVASAVGGPLTAALEILADQDPSPLPLDMLAHNIPVGHAALGRLALIAARSLNAKAPRDPEERADYLNMLFARLRDAGDHAAALEAITEVVAICRRLAKPPSTKFTPELAMALNNLSIQQGTIGDRAAALRTIIKSVKLYRKLAKSSPDKFLPELAMSLNNLAARQRAAGDSSAALKAANEAVAIRRKLAAVDPVTFLPNLATSLQNLSAQHGELGESRAALENILEAVKIYRTLTESNPATFLPRLASSLHNLAIEQRHSGDRKAGLKSIIEAVAIRRELVKSNDTAFLPSLASSLSNLGSHQRAAGDREAAVKSDTEAVEIYRDLTKVNLTAFRPQLGHALSNLGNHQGEAGDHVGALKSITESVEIFRDLTKENPAAFQVDFATSLNNLAIIQSDTGNPTLALQSIIESVEIYRSLTASNPAAFLPQLATSLHTLSNRQSDVGDRMAALESSTEAVAIRRVLAKSNSAAFLPDLAASLDNLSSRQHAVGNWSAAVASSTEALTIRRDLAMSDPTAFLPTLGSSLNNLAVQLGDAGDRMAALESITEAVAIRRRLAKSQPAVFLPALAMSLDNLSNQQSANGALAEALASSTESVGIYRYLVKPGRSEFLWDLSLALNNLSIRQSEAGNRFAALESITEAVAIRRRLAESNAAAFLPDLAMSLSNLSTQLGANGDQAKSLDVISEAVEIYRRLAESLPAAFLPGLASSLNNLSIQQRICDNKEAALVSVTEAVEIFRSLAAATPEAFLPKLSFSLGNLSNQQQDADDLAAALASSAEAVEINKSLTKANPRAFIKDFISSLKQLADKLTADGQHDRAHSLTRDAAEEFADGPAIELLLAAARHSSACGQLDEATATLDRAAAMAEQITDTFWAGRVRQVARSSVAEQPALGRSEASTRHPWLTASLPDDFMTILADWGDTDNWPDRESFLRENHEALRAQPGADCLTLAVFVHPTVDSLRSLQAVLAKIDEQGLELAFASYRDLSDHLDKLSAWLNTTTWNESLRTLRDHPELLSDPRTTKILEPRSSHDVVSRQHLGIIKLSHTKSLNEVYDAVKYPEISADMILEALTCGDLETAHALHMVTPKLHEVLHIGAFALAVLSALDGDPDRAREMITRAFSEASELQVNVDRSRLENLAVHYPAQADLLRELATIVIADR
ncbi:hypothetical protein AB0J55_17425 [Amycolatopsis sp. NPDC049688]|uniref:P-loop NTPase n=1 Tax=Amycolatopsis sp. NPDC049688 TaxID=3154733 RepID=UPI00342F9D18